jgi:hypothetical protein
MYHSTKNVILYEKDPIIYYIWKYIIEDATPERILSFPILEVGENINDKKFQVHELLGPEKDLIGYFLGFGAKTRKMPSPSPNFCKWNTKNRQLLSEDICKVKHWKIYNKSYELSESIKATWFIDPPYQGNGGKYYTHSNKDIDYERLSEWVNNRKGQVIVCENEEGNWLPFEILMSQTQQGRTHTEMIYHRS